MDWIILLLIPWAFLFSPSCVCCFTSGDGTPCSVCIDYATPTTIDVTISGVGAGNASPCLLGGDLCASSLNTTHTLTQSASNPCRYELLDINDPQGCSFDLILILTLFSSTEGYISFYVTASGTTHSHLYRRIVALPPDPMACMDSIGGSMSFISHISLGTTCTNMGSLTITLSPNA